MGSDGVLTDGGALGLYTATWPEVVLAVLAVIGLFMATWRLHRRLSQWHGTREAFVPASLRTVAVANLRRILLRLATHAMILYASSVMLVTMNSPANLTTVVVLMLIVLIKILDGALDEYDDHVIAVRVGEELGVYVDPGT